MDKRRECDTEHLRDYPDCFEECEHDKCVAVEPKPSGRLLTEELQKIWLWWQESGENYGQLIDAVSAKTASIKDAEQAKEWHVYQETISTLGGLHEAEIEKMESECQARIEALIKNIIREAERKLYPTNTFCIGNRVNSFIHWLKATHLKGGEG